MPILLRLKNLYDTAFDRIETTLEDWFPGLFARFVFLAVLYPYFLTSARTKVGHGLFGFFDIQPGAYYQIALPAVEAAGGDVSAIPFFPWGMIVFAGTYAEFLLPLLVVLGLFTRAAAIGMIGFIIVQSIVDVTVHMTDSMTIGALFDRFPDGLIVDQRLLWAVPLVFLIVKGAGLISLDALFSRGFRILCREADMEKAALH